MFVDKRAVAAIVVLVVLIAGLAGGLLVFLNRAELPDVNIAGVVEDVREAISGLFSGAEEEVMEAPTSPPVVEEQNESEDVIEESEAWFSEALLVTVEQNVSTTAARDGFIYFASVPEDTAGRIEIGQFAIEEQRALSSQFTDWDPEWLLEMLDLSVEDLLDLIESGQFAIEGQRTLSFQSMVWDPERVVQVFALSVTEDLEYRMFLTDITPAGTERRFFYVQYSPEGELLSQHAFPADLFESLDNLSSVAVAFTGAGELVVQGIDGCDTRIVVMDTEGTIRGEFDPGCGRIGRARDGRIVFARDHEEDLWELDLEAVSFGAQLAESNVTGVVQSTMLLEGSFDLYFNRTVDDIRYLYGYMIETGAWTRLFAWEELGTGLDGTFFPVISLPDGSVVVRERFNDLDRTDFILLVPEA